MKTVILETEAYGKAANIDGFRKYGELVTYLNTEDHEIAERIKDADVVVVNKCHFNEETAGDCPNLKLVCENATGYDNVDVDYLRRRGVAFTNVPSYSTPTVVQVTTAMVLSLITKLPDYQESVRNGKYTACGNFCLIEPTFHDITGKTWGIVGYGNIGQGVAKVAEALGCKVIVYRAHPTGADYEVDLETLCKEADIISLHCPLNEQTRSLIGKEQLEIMKDSAILINVARGAVVDEAAVADAVLKGKIGALGQDVYSAEPMSANHPYNQILSLSNVCLTPHMAWGSQESIQRAIDVIIDNVEAFLKGEKLNRID